MTRSFLTTADCAVIVGMSTRYIRDEISAGRLEAEVITRRPLPQRQRAQRLIRVYPEQFAAYLGLYWPRVQWQPLFHGQPQRAQNLHDV